jgi:hypothetical protein
MYLASARPEIGKNEISGHQKLKFRWQQLRGDDHCQPLNEHLLITVIFGRTSLATGEKIKEKLYFYATCLRASVSKLAETMEAHT